MKISVVIAYYNGGKYIKEQLESILSQLAPEDEVILSIDGASDGSEPVSYTHLTLPTTLNV